MKDHMIMLQKKRPAFLHYINRRTKQRNQNCLIATTGGTGSGKSYTMLSLGQSIARINKVEFGIMHVCFSASEFMRLLNSGELKRGSFIILDEAGVSINAKKWQSEVNIVMNYVVQTFRAYNYCVALCSPYLEFIDSSIRKMMHVWLATDNIDYDRKLARVKPYILSFHQRDGGIFTRFMVVKRLGVPPVKVERVAFKLASSDLIDAYEIKKRSFNDGLNQKIMESLQVNEEGGVVDLTATQEKILMLWNEYGLKQYEIGRGLGMDNGAVSRALKACKKKGHLVNRGSTAKSNMSDEDIKLAIANMEERLKLYGAGKEDNNANENHY
jgi:hypothetical protein